MGARERSVNFEDVCMRQHCVALRGWKTSHHPALPRKLFMSTSKVHRRKLTCSPANHPPSLVPLLLGVMHWSSMHAF